VYININRKKQTWLSENVSQVFLSVYPKKTPCLHRLFLVFEQTAGKEPLLAGNLKNCQVKLHLYAAAASLPSTSYADLGYIEFPIISNSKPFPLDLAFCHLLLAILNSRLIKLVEFEVCISIKRAHSII